MSVENREIYIGTITIMVIGLLMGGLSLSEKIADKAAPDEVLITAKFNKIDGLLVGDEVRMGGIQIGEIKSAELDEFFRAVLTLRFDQQVPLPLDTSASIQTDGLFGSKFIVLEPGAEEDFLKNGDEITYTQDALIVGELLEMIISEGKAAQIKRQKAE